MSYAHTITRDMRLALLRLLADPEARYTLNSSILYKLLAEKTGYHVSKDKVVTELSWLKEQGLVTLKDGTGCYIVTITQRGLEVAGGIVTVPGVDRPSPDAGDH